MTECSICGAEIHAESDTIVGELLTCGDCGCELEVTDLDPFTLTEAPQQAEDWGE